MLSLGESKLSQAFLSLHTDIDSFNKSKKPIRIIKTKDNRYLEIRRTPYAIFSTEIEEVPELKDKTSDIKWADDYILLIPKIPKFLLYEILEVFKNAYPNECLVNICWNMELKEFYLRIPEQKTTINRVYYQKLADDIVVMELHSHGILKAYFSKTDDKDELATGFYGVMGKVKSKNPQLRVRYSCGGRFKEIHPASIFDLEG